MGFWAGVAIGGTLGLFIGIGLAYLSIRFLELRATQ